MASEYTTNFNLDLYTDSDKPNLRDQYNSAMRKVDTQLLVNTGNTTAAFNLAKSAKDTADKSAENIEANKTAIAKNASDIATNKSAISKNATDIATNKTAISKNATDIVSLKNTTSKNTTDIAANKTAIAKNANDIANIGKNIFPITSDKIAAGAVTRDKLDAQAIESIIKGLSIRRFDNNDSTADNDGLCSNDICEIAGYYIPELTLLVISKFDVNYNGLGGTAASGFGIPLPNYVPNITKSKKEIGKAIVWNSSSNFDTWTAVMLLNSNKLGVSSYDKAKRISSLGNFVVFLRPFGVA